MRTVIVTAVSLALCGCAGNSGGPTQAATDAALKSGFEAAKADCQARFPVSPGRNHVAHARCLNEYVTSVLLRLRYPDLSVLISTKRIELAEKVDKGTMTEAEADAELAQTRAKAQRELRKGAGILRVAKMLRLGTGTVHRIKREMAAPQ
jgi:hypothetical protein